LANFRLNGFPCFDLPARMQDAETGRDSAIYPRTAADFPVTQAQYSSKSGAIDG
jgi:hypothetical protein